MSADQITVALLMRCQRWFQQRAEDDDDLDFHNSEECEDQENKLVGDLAAELTRLGVLP